jgi:hypothetical protein
LDIAGWLFSCWLLTGAVLAGWAGAGFTIGATALALGGATRRGLSDNIRPIIR